MRLLLSATLHELRCHLVALAQRVLEYRRLGGRSGWLQLSNLASSATTFALNRSIASACAKATPTTPPRSSKSKASRIILTENRKPIPESNRQTLSREGGEIIPQLRRISGRASALGLPAVADAAPSTNRHYTQVSVFAKNFQKFLKRLARVTARAPDARSAASARDRRGVVRVQKRARPRVRRPSAGPSGEGTRGGRGDVIMAEFTVNPTRFDPYKNFKFRLRWDGRYIAGISHVSGLRRSPRWSSIARAATRRRRANRRA